MDFIIKRNRYDSNSPTSVKTVQHEGDTHARLHFNRRR